MAAGLGTCAQDPAQSPLAADEIRSCWEANGDAGLGAMTAASRPQAVGLFAEDEIVPPAPRPSTATEPTTARNPTRASRARRPKPPLEDPGRAAWVESESDALVEAPTIEPGMRLSTEVQRRRRRWFR